MVVVRSKSLKAEDYASKEEETEAREAQALKMVKAAMEEMGGENGVRHFITKGDVVVIKPNVAFDKNPDLGATTSPDTVSAVVKLCKEAGARKVIVCDNPINNPESCFFKTKVGDAALRAAELMMPQDSLLRAALRRGRDHHQHLADVLSTVPRGHQGHRDLSPVKDDNLCKATVTMKNWYGLLGNPRNQFHQNIHGIISDFALDDEAHPGDRRRPQAPDEERSHRRQPQRDVKKSDTIVVGTGLRPRSDSWCITRLLEKQAATTSSISTR